MTRSAAIIAVLLTGICGTLIPQEAEGGLEDSATEDDLFGASTEEGISDEEALFGGEEEENALFADVAVTDVDTTEDSSILAPVSLAFAEGPEIGGRYSFSLGNSWSWLEQTDGDGFGSAESAFVTDLGATLILDARPSDDLRVLLKSNLSYPFREDIFHISELFSDFQFGDRLFLRGGKHQLTWGVGYFFSPADVLNVTAIDPEDPDAEREGPVSLKANVPIGSHNLYLYLVADRAGGGTTLGYAPKIEMVLGSTEIGAGGYVVFDPAADALFSLHPNRPPTGMLTISSSLGKTAVFGETVLAYGTERSYLTLNPDDPSDVSASQEEEDRLIPSATMGFNRSFPGPDNDRQLTVAAQYLYNGDGESFEDLSDILSILRDNPTSVASLGILLGSGAIKTSDVLFVARHYAAASIGWGAIGGTDFSAGLFAMARLATELPDFSSRIVADMTWRPTDHLSLSAAAAVTLGEKGIDFSPFGDSLAITVTASLGGGRF